MEEKDGLYTLYLYHISYFSGKMEAYLHYKEVPLKIEEPHWLKMAWDIYNETGLMKVPVVKTPEGEWLQDTTPMIFWFEKKFPDYPILPENKTLAFILKLLEDYADEWLWRPALHYRWSYKEDAMALSQRFSETFLRFPLIPNFLIAWNLRRRQRQVYIEGDGVSKETWNHVESIYLNNLKWLSDILEDQPFLFGTKPSLMDFGFYASMKKHFSKDPTPSKIMKEKAPKVFEWVQRLGQVKGSQVQGSFLDSIPENFGPLLKDCGEAYLPYLKDNALAYKEGLKTFNCTVQGVTYKNLPVYPYRVWCREKIQEDFLNLPETNKKEVEALLNKYDCLKPLLSGGTISSNLHKFNQPPFCPKKSPSLFKKLKLALFGTAWEKED